MELTKISRDRSDMTTAKRHWCFSLPLLITFSLATPPLAALGISPHSDYYSHIPLIPLVSAYLFYLRRNSLFDATHYEPRWGLPVAGTGLLLYAAGMWIPWLNQHESPSLRVSSSLLFLFGSFVSYYGTRAFRRSIFPLLFLLFAVPVPDALMDRIIYFLQVGSAQVTDMIFRATGIPYLREGLVFHLPGFSIEIAKQCSGIRSSLALLITVVLAAHFFLRTYWQKALLVVSILPIVLLKNGIRISVLTLLAMSVDQRILTGGFLHKSGGFIFFIPALALMGIILWQLRRVNGDWSLSIVRCIDSGKRSAGSSPSTEPATRSTVGLGRPLTKGASAPEGVADLIHSECSRLSSEAVRQAHRPEWDRGADS